MWFNVSGLVSFGLVKDKVANVLETVQTLKDNIRAAINKYIRAVIESTIMRKCNETFRQKGMPLKTPAR